MIAELPWQMSEETLKSFCRKWKIEELSLFGSALRSDFGPDSDFDVLAKFAQDAQWSVFDHARMSDELTTLLGRRVDIIETADLSNPFRRHEILTTRKVIYAA